jgi:hypothetical protein
MEFLKKDYSVWRIYYDMETDEIIRIFIFAILISNIMELYDNIFNDIMEFNDYVNMRLIENNLYIIPIIII